MADTKVTALTELTSVAGTDLLYIVDDPGGSPISKKATAANVWLGGFTAGANEADAKVNYTTGDLDSEAEVISAFNTTNGKINSIIAKLEALGLLASS